MLTSIRRRIVGTSTTSSSSTGVTDPADPRWGTAAHLTPTHNSALQELLPIAQALLGAHAATFPADHLAVRAFPASNGGGDGADDDGGESEELVALSLQFLRARQFNVAKAQAMLTAVVQRRGETRPWELTEDAATHPQASNTFFFTGEVTKAGMPFFYGMMRLMDRQIVDLTRFQQAIVYMLEKAVYRSNFGSERIVVAFDFANWSMAKHVSRSAYREMVTVLQDNYPERLGRVYLINYPTSISAAYAIVSPLMDRRTTSKIQWVSRSPSTVLAEEFESPKPLPVWLGGSSEFRIPGVDVETEWKGYPL